ncbi:sporulation integral membrane protein YtvI [Paenibacillus sp. SYP-B4298]|uniref:sporulation integral membrane protein YtvI n=1 Tax=Paenibacillus sp. SYP-B4298 TaxID=2996034 RepID=UPI0022DE7A8A|nr:sporulation integral membrane protein YtvI [Paenibacillus sp. SYP-B4298]
MSVRAMVTAGVGLALLYLLFTAGAPFLLALVVAIFLEPLVQLLMHSLHLKRAAAATITSTLFTLLLLGLIVLLGVKVIAELIDFWNKVPHYIGTANMVMQDTIAGMELYYTRLTPDTQSQLQSWLSTFSNSISSLVTGISASFVSFAKGIPGLFIFFTVFIVAVYLLGYSLHTLKIAFLSFFELKSRQQVNEVLDSLRRSIFGFLRSQLILSMLTYIMTLIGLLFLDLKYPLAIALLIVFVDLLPILGTGAVLIPWAAYLLGTGDSYTGVGLLLLFLLITIFRRVVEPKILGDAVGISALSALVSLYVGFKLAGVIGVFIGPMVVIIFTAAREAGLLQTKIKL